MGSSEHPGCFWLWSAPELLPPQSFLVQLFSGFRHGFGLRLVFQALVQRGNLRPDVTNLVDGVMGLRDPITNLEQQVKLFLQVLLCDLESRVGLDFQRRGLRLAVDREAYLIVAGKRFRAVSVPAQSGERGTRLAPSYCRSHTKRFKPASVGNPRAAGVGRLHRQRPLRRLCLGGYCGQPVLSGPESPK